MIKLVVKNMSCGHCQLKIKAELESHNYQVMQIDMNKNTVLIDTCSKNTNEITKILDKINYIIDDQIPILDIVEYTIWDDKLIDETNYDRFSNYIDELELKIIGFDDENLGVIIQCTDSQITAIHEYINDM